MALRIALTGQLLVGDAEFANVNDVDVPFPTGGPWRPGRYAVAGLPVTAELTTILIAGATDNEDYTAVVKGRSYTINSGVAATVTTIRDALRAAVDADPPPDITTADVAADGFSVASDLPGVGLKISVTADTPANISISARSAAPAVLGVISQDSGQVTLRSPGAAITARVGMVVAAA